MKALLLVLLCGCAQHTVREHPALDSPTADGFSQSEAEAIIERNAQEREKAIRPYRLRIE